MSDTKQRLDAYKAAELRILSGGAELSFDQRRRREAELAEIRKAIRELEAILANETRPGGSSAGSLRYKTAVFCR